MSVRMRHTRAHTGNRRSHHALTAPRLSTCEKCSELHLRHKVCLSCGSYRGKVVLDIAATAQKKADKKKAREKAEQGIAR